jgi:uncharacterized protein (TIGR03643 family)
MGLSAALKSKIDSFSTDDIDRMIRMGWEDRTTFEAIQTQFRLSENEFVRLMRSQLSSSDFLRWRKRIHRHGHLKHEKNEASSRLDLNAHANLSMGLRKDGSDFRPAVN